jgi:hypothetical protein
MPRGGKRDNAGRPAGTTGIKKKPPRSKSKEVAIVIAAAEEEVRKHISGAAAADPEKRLRAIDVMRDNMTFFHRVGEVFLDKAEKAYQEGPDKIPVALDFMAENAKYRMLSQKCAESIVPYEERRLAGHEPREDEAPAENGDGARDVTPATDRLAHLSDRYKTAVTLETEDVEG